MKKRATSNNKDTTIVAHNPVELAKVLGLDGSYGYRWMLRNELVTKLIEVVKKEGLTHAEIAKRVKTSRTRVTSILNNNIEDVSTDLLLRIFEMLGYMISVSISRGKVGA